MSGKQPLNFTCQIEKGWVPVCHMKEFFALDASSLKHFSMDKSNSSDPSLPQGAFVSTEGPVITSATWNTSVIGRNNQQGVVP